VWKREPAFFYSKGEYMERIGDEQKMTVKEVSDALGCKPDTVQKIARRLEQEGKIARIEIRPDFSKALMLNEEQVHEIKKAIVPRTLDMKVQSENTVTSLDIEEMTLKVIKYHQDKIAQLKAENEAQREKIAIDAPKIAFHDAVTGSKDTIDIGEASKVLAVKGFGRNNLFERLRNEGILMQNNQPYQKYIDAGYFRTIESSFTAPDGTTHVNIKTVVYQKGLDFIRKVINS
jgi:phage antirepressor YoqD-like protein